MIARLAAPDKDEILPDRLAELLAAVPQPIDAPAAYLHSRLIGPEESEEDGDVDEWVALDAAVAQQMALGGGRVVLRVGPGAQALLAAPRLEGLSLEAVVRGASPVALVDAAHAVLCALEAGLPLRAVLADGDTGVEAYRAAAAARHAIGTALPIRVRWDGVLDVKGAALALSFGADQLAGPLAPARERWKLAQIGGPAEDKNRPSPAYVESLIRAARRLPGRRR
jgi:hypothetical protein